jgi:glycosyltransferase involved in cell wall biosynthesis
LKILIVSQHFWPENFIINDLALRLTDIGDEVIVLTGNPSYPNKETFHEFYKNKTSFSKLKNITIYRVPLLSRGGSYFSLFFNYLSFIFTASTLGLFKIRKINFDKVFVFQTSPVFSAIPAIIYAKFKGIPLAIWILDLWPHTILDLKIFSNLIWKKFLKWVSFYIYDCCNLILVQSEKFIPILKSELKKSNIKYFPNWPLIDLQGVNITYSKIIKKAPGTFTVMYAGNVGKAQDFESVISAFDLLRSHKNIRLIIVGHGSAINFVKEKVQHMNLKNILLVGSHPKEEMPFIIKHADALLVSLEKRAIFSLTIPAKLQAYMTSGKPILGMVDGEASRIIKESKSGLISKAGDFKSLAENIIFLSKLKHTAMKEFGLNGIKYVNHYFNSVKSIHKLRAYLHELS